MREEMEDQGTEPPSSPHSHQQAMGDDSTCHILPCNISYTGMAPTHVYFRPVQTDQGFHACMFRGRGILAVSDQHLGFTNSDDSPDDHEGTPSEKGFVLSVGDDGVTIKSSFDNMREWHHQHHPNTLLFDALPNPKTSRRSAASEWLNISNALHEPLPLEEE